MTRASQDELVTYLADLVERMERLAVTVLAPNDEDEVELGRTADGTLTVDLELRLPASRRSADVELDVYERWNPVADAFERGDYRFELRHRGLDYRRAYHQHDVDHFARHYRVVTHEHCESTMGLARCSHYEGSPVADAIDGFERLYALWLTGAPPDCRALHCLG